MNQVRPILLAEDSPQDVELTLSAFEDNNIANPVVIARDGEEALDYLYRRGQFANRNPGNPAVVLLDLKMPKVNGLEALAVIKGDSQLRTIPVVMLTSSREEIDLLRSYELGVNAYVVKPVEFRSFVDAVKEIGVFWAVLNETAPERASKEN
jgi:CheY-like chemotaxis protein